MPDINSETLPPTAPQEALPAWQDEAAQYAETPGAYLAGKLSKIGQAFEHTLPGLNLNILGARKALESDDFDAAQRVFESAGQAHAEELRPVLYELHKTDMIQKGAEQITYGDTIEKLQNKANSLLSSDSEARQSGGSKLKRATQMSMSSDSSEALRGTSQLLSEVEHDIELKAKSSPASPEELTNELFELRGMRNTLYDKLQTQITKQQKAQEHVEQTGRVTSAREAVAAAHNPSESDSTSPETAIDEKSLALSLAKYEKVLATNPTKEAIRQFPDYLRNQLRLLTVRAARISAEQGNTVRYPDTVAAVIGEGAIGDFVYSALTGSGNADPAKYKEFLRQPFSVVADRFRIDLKKEFPDYAQTFASRENRHST